MSFTRIQIIDKDRYSFDLGSRSHFWRSAHYRILNPGLQSRRDWGFWP